MASLAMNSGGASRFERDAAVGAVTGMVSSSESPAALSRTVRFKGTPCEDYQLWKKKRPLWGLIPYFVAGTTAVAEPPEPRSWESLLTQPSLLDGPASLKESLRGQGLNFDASWTQFHQGAVLGEAQHNWRYGGKIDLIGNVDLTRFGLWPGFSLTLHQEFNYGRDVNNAGTGLIIPANTSMAFPRLGGGNANTSISLTQRFNERISLTAGKINMLQALETVPLAQVSHQGIDLGLPREDRLSTNPLSWHTAILSNFPPNPASRC
jgi:hypothetical protein